MSLAKVVAPAQFTPALARRVSRCRITPAVVALTVLASGCVPMSRAPEAEAQRAELSIRSLMAAWESADAATIEDLFWPDATYDDYPNQHTHEGAQEIVAYVMALHAWADDVYFNVGEVHVTQSGAVAEWVFSAVQARPMGRDFPVATGREVVSNGVTIIELDGGRIRRAADYMDTRPIMLQLGAKLEVPGSDTGPNDPR